MPSNNVNKISSSYSAIDVTKAIQIPELRQRNQLSNFFGCAMPAQWLAIFFCGPRHGLSRVYHVHQSFHNPKYDFILYHDVWNFTIFLDQEWRIEKEYGILTTMVAISSVFFFNHPFVTYMQFEFSIIENHIYICGM